MEWQEHIQLTSFYTKDGVFCQKAGPTDGHQARFQTIDLSSLVTDFIASFQDSKTFGPLGVSEFLQKNRQHFYWPGFNTDVEHELHPCENCCKR